MQSLNVLQLKYINELQNNMSKLIITTGLPRSGKTTWAKEMVAKSGNHVRINRDDLRVMLHNNKWTPRNEEVTMACQKAMVEAALKKGKHVIIDDTNLGSYHHERWLGVAREQGVAFEAKNFKSTDIPELIRRDDFDDESRRGAHVIIRLALENDFIKFQDDEVVVCDLDGTLCNIEHRLKYARGEEKDWDKFFKGVPGDTIREDVDKMLQGYVDQGKKIIFVSARPERCRRDTEMWLSENGYALSYRLDPEDNYIRYEALLMRPDSNSQDDTIIKQNILDNCLKKEWIHRVIDDRPKVIRMWQENGLEVIDVGPGIEF
jgi:predicted kinase